MECIEALAAYGCDLNHNISDVGTPLYLACVHKQIASAKTLLDLGKTKSQMKQRKCKVKQMYFKALSIVADERQLAGREVAKVRVRSAWFPVGHYGKLFDLSSCTL